MDLVLLYFLILFLSSLLLLLLVRRTGPTGTSSNHCPYPNPILGNLIPFLRNRHRFLDWAASLLSLSPTATIEVLGPFSLSHGVATANPSIVNHFLISNFHNYVKGSRIHSALSDLLGNGLFIADGDLWFLQRKIASREFTTRSLRTFSADVFQSHIHDRLLPVLSAAAASGEIVDLQDVLKRFAFDNICTISFGHDPGCLSLDRNRQQHKLFFDAFDDSIEISFNRLLSPIPFLWVVMKYFNVGSERRLKEAINTINEFATEIIKSKDLLQGSQKQDLLSRFMAATKEEDSGYYNFGTMFEDPKEKQRFLRDVIVSFVLAGKDSTSSGLTWFFWLLSTNPNVETKIYEEISSINENFDYEELKGLNYLHAAITESLRLYPPVPINSRVVKNNDILPDGTHVRAGWFADYSAYAMGRDQRMWGPDAEAFLPQRWLDDKGQFVPADPCKFSAFHAGPRACLGREMAYVQMKAVVAAVLRMFHLEPAGDKNIVPAYEMAVTLRMKGGLPVHVKKREKTTVTGELRVEV
ncbi:Cytochrome P450 94A2 [Rhynchospora pubera]|uniref:Cytochrome P450 94A2 n=1 Tax=Rhynchospora pubera TaxID=906938 RepID=A0AAV8GMK5_9POAL|nr:Cytochrome P450 94A2 [Rhynchospora pubera]